MNRNKRVVFLDRDGVLNEYKPGAYVNGPEDLRPLPRAMDALGALAREGIAVVVISNQAGVGKGFMTREDLTRVTERLVARAAEAGGKVEEFRYCVHRPDAGCTCRKPAPGMILDAAGALGIAPTACWMIGDAESDIGAGAAAGAKTCLVLSGKTRSEAETAEWKTRPDRTARDLAEAVEAIFGIAVGAAQA